MQHTYNQLRAFLNANFSPSHYTDDNAIVDGDDESGATIATMHKINATTYELRFADGISRRVPSPATYNV